jgi:hypothetical protein
MDISELLRYVAGVLERLGIPYFVTGSVATIFFGEPRLTNDIDIVIDLPPNRIPALCAAFPGEFYLSEEAVRRAVSRRGQFNVIHPTSGLKVDLIVTSGSAFDRSRFFRVRRLTPSPEDVILKKLEFYQEGGSDKHLRDIASILKVSGETLDRTYIAEWADRLGLAEIWREVRDRALRPDLS